ncbi:hypothetical protein SLS64_006476 [Diaporthe eres]|uniref:Uncharacterized protein n=1 Tax=Diaporthe eres TaxID=83184 RepID=A0ABR1P9S5_DIAER
MGQSRHLAKYKLINTHLQLRLYKLEGEHNVREWPLVVKYGGADHAVAAEKVQVLCMVTDDGTGVQHAFSRLSDFSSTWFIPSKFVPIIWQIMTACLGETEQCEFESANWDFIAQILGIRRQFRPYLHDFVA